MGFTQPVPLIFATICTWRLSLNVPSLDAKSRISERSASATVPTHWYVYLHWPRGCYNSPWACPTSTQAISISSTRTPKFAGQPYHSLRPKLQRARVRHRQTNRNQWMKYKLWPRVYTFYFRDIETEKSDCIYCNNERAFMQQFAEVDLYWLFVFPSGLQNYET